VALKLTVPWSATAAPARDVAGRRDEGSGADRRFSVKLEFAASPGVVVNLRRSSADRSCCSDREGERLQACRADAMRRHRQAL
jgi:hypothetical protein